MNKAFTIRILLLTMLAAALFLVSIVGQPEPAEAQTCPTIGCYSWQYFGCCSGNTKLYQIRKCCQGTTCCNQYRCITAACPI
jgi:hypothetical protein